MIKENRVGECPQDQPAGRDAGESSLLVARVQAGDRQAARCFIEKFQRLVAAIVFRMVYNAADREELCQEIFLKIFAHIDEFQGGAKISSWIGRIASNTCINHLRKKRPCLYEDIAGPEADMGDVASEGPTPESLGEQADLNSRLQREVERLPARYRVIVTLFHFAEMNYEEIGRALELPPGTVKSHLFRARQKLRDRLAPALQEEA